MVTKETRVKVQTIILYISASMCIFIYKQKHLKYIIFSQSYKNKLKKGSIILTMLYEIKFTSAYSLFLNFHAYNNVFPSN